MKDKESQFAVFLERWKKGDLAALHNMFTMAYPRLITTAQRLLAQAPELALMEARELVHNIYLELKNQKNREIENESHFIHRVGMLMRFSLHDKIKYHNAGKRNHGNPVISLVDLNSDC